MTSPRPLPDFPPEPPLRRSGGQTPRSPFPVRQPARDSRSRIFVSPAPRPAEPLLTALSPCYNKNDASKSYFEQCYEVLSELGKGSFARVVKVRRKDDGAIYAVKEFSRPVRGPRDREKLLSEINISQRVLDCEQCLRYYDAWEEGGRVYIQIEFCEQGSLDRKLCGGPLPEADVLRCVADVALGLSFLHWQGAMHLDVKPANIFCTAHGRYKIGDFGNAALMRQKEVEDGDSVYLAPEMVKQAYASPAADVYSLGVSVLELCSALQPEPGPLYEGIIDRRLTAAMSPALKTLAAAMLSPDPAKRPTMDQVLAHPLIAPHVRRTALPRRAVSSLRKWLHTLRERLRRLGHSLALWCRQAWHSLTRSQYEPLQPRDDEAEAPEEGGVSDSPVQLRSLRPRALNFEAAGEGVAPSTLQQRMQSLRAPHTDRPSTLRPPDVSPFRRNLQSAFDNAG